MTSELKDKFDPAAEALERGARENNPDLCAEFYGTARFGILNSNARALRIAAENKSYDAFERMLELAGSCPVPSQYSIGYGKDWDRFNELAAQDPRLKAALDGYHRTLDDFYGSLVVESAPAPPAANFFSRLKFW